MPDGRTVIGFVFPDVPPDDRRWWLVITGEGVDACDFDPGHPVRVTVETSLRTLTRIWRGRPAVGHRRCAPGDLVLHGEPQACRALPRWFTLSSLAPTPRPAPRVEMARV